MLKKFIFLLVMFLNFNLIAQDAQLKPEVICILDSQDFNLQYFEDIEGKFQQDEDDNLSFREKLKLLIQFKYLESKAMAKDQLNLTKEQVELIKKYWQQYLALGLSVCILGGTLYFLYRK